MDDLKDIEGYEGRYAVTEDGKIFSYYRNKFVAYEIDKDGYKKVLLHKDGERKNVFVHRLVAKAFLDNPKGLPCVNHKDENKTNNKVSNLEWCTVSYNNSYGTRPKALSKAMSKPVINLDTGEKYSSATEAERKTGLYHQHISKCCKGKLKTHGGYHWTYL